MRSRPKLILGEALCAICLLLAIGARVPRAEAQVLPDVTGTFFSAAFFTPGIVLAPRPITISATGNLGNLVSPSGALPSNIVSATYTINGSGTIGCLSAGGASGEGQIKWRDANNDVVAQSEAEWSITAGAVILPTATSTITQGLFAGDTFIPVILAVIPNGICGLLFGPTTGANATGAVVLLQ